MIDTFFIMLFFPSSFIAPQFYCGKIKISLSSRTGWKKKSCYFLPLCLLGAWDPCTRFVTIFRSCLLHGRLPCTVINMRDSHIKDSLARLLSRLIERPHSISSPARLLTPPSSTFFRRLSRLLRWCYLAASALPVVRIAVCWWHTCHLPIPCPLWKVRDSNPRCFYLPSLCARCLQPLGQPSVASVLFFSLPSFVYCLAILSPPLPCHRALRFSAGAAFYLSSFMSS